MVAMYAPRSSALSKNRPPRTTAALPKARRSDADKTPKDDTPKIDEGPESAGDADARLSSIFDPFIKRPVVDAMQKRWGSAMMATANNGVVGGGSVMALWAKFGQRQFQRNVTLATSLATSRTAPEVTAAHAEYYESMMADWREYAADMSGLATDRLAQIGHPLERATAAMAKAYARIPKDNGHFV